MQDVVKEMETQRTKYYDSSTAVKVGRLAGAEYIVVGAFAALQPKMRIDTRVVRVETGEIVKTAQVTGDEDKFFDLEQKLAKNLIDGLDSRCRPKRRRRSRRSRSRIASTPLSTMLNFSKSLNFYDRGEYGEAAQMMLPVMQASPRSMLVQMTYDEIKRRAAAMAAQKAKDKIKSGLGGFLRRP